MRIWELSTQLQGEQNMILDRIPSVVTSLTTLTSSANRLKSPYRLATWISGAFGRFVRMINSYKRMPVNQSIHTMSNEQPPHSHRGSYS